MVEALTGGYMTLACEAEGFLGLTIVEAPAPELDAATPMVGTPLGLLLVVAYWTSEASASSFAAAEREWIGANTGMILSEPMFASSGPVLVSPEFSGRVCPG